LRCRCHVDTVGDLIGLDDAARARYDALAAAMPELRAMFDAHRRLSWVEHPLARYANAVKHRSPLTSADFTYVPQEGRPNIAMAARAVAGEHVRPPNWRVGLVPRELNHLVIAAHDILPLFLEMQEVEPGDPKAVDLYRKMAQSRPSRLPRLQPAWHRLVKRRISWVKRVRLALF
jgi:hypothetical protein